MMISQRYTILSLPLILLSVAYFTTCVAAAAQHLRSRSLKMFHDNDSLSITCCYVRGDLLMEDGSNVKLHACQDDNGNIYDLDPSWMDELDEDALIGGETRLLIKGLHRASHQQSHYTYNDGAMKSRAMPHDDHVNAQAAPPEIQILQMAVARDTGTVYVKTMGTGNVVAVRVTSLDAQVSLSSSVISESLFGSDISFATQMAACSNDMLVFEPPQGIPGGVVELSINVKTVGISTMDYQQKLFDTLKSKYGDLSRFDHIMFCLPKGSGTTHWVAYAYRDSQFSFFNDEWCGSLTAKLHEVGHNLGLGHSGESGQSYEDRSCIMGVSFYDTTWPRECFNAYRSWTLSWFQQHQVSVDPVADGRPWVGNLAAFVDYKEMSNDDYAIVNVGDLYFQYNRAKKHNEEVQEKANEVTLVLAGASADATSTLMAGLQVSSQPYAYVYNGNTYYIDVCEPGSHNGVDFYRVSVYANNQQSGCVLSRQFDSQNPTRSPTVPPTRLPTPSPTSTPTPSPTRAPTPKPTPQPTPNPTHTPTLSPTPAPTPRPTLAPAPNPTPPPTPNPTRSPTVPPTPNLTPSPTLPPAPSPTPPPTSNPSRSPTLPPTPNPTSPPTPNPTLRPTLPITSRTSLPPSPASTLSPTLSPSPLPAPEQVAVPSKPVRCKRGACKKKPHSGGTGRMKRTSLLGLWAIGRYRGK